MVDHRFGLLGGAVEPSGPVGHHWEDWEEP